MKKTLLIVTLGLSLFLAACNKPSSSPTTTTITGEQQLPIYMSGNYYPVQHVLSIRGSGLTTMPDICKDITTGKILLDIWSIDLSNNKITDINADYSCLPNLQEINLAYNQITHIKNLEKLNFLKKLELHKNELTDIAGLEDLTSLNELNLGYNQLTSVKGLEDLSNLTTLELQHNQIKDIGPLENLRNLETLKVEYNQIKDPIQFDAIKEVIKGLKFFSTGENVN